MTFLRPILIACAITIGGLCAAGAPTTKPSEASSSRPSSQQQKQRQRWENAILFYGDEATGEWSLRIRDKDIDAQHEFRLRELWNYDSKADRWIKLTSDPARATIVPPDQRPASASPDEILVVLPIEREQVGLYYARWRVDEIDGATFCRLGPGLRQRSPLEKQKPPPDKIYVVVPLDLKHAEPRFIPDPRIACEAEKQHGE